MTRPGYAIAHFTTLSRHSDVMDYLERIQETLDPFSGRFIVHGGEVEELEGGWKGTVAVIAFPGIAEARGWYRSAAYQAILPLRTSHIEASAILVEGVPDGYDPAATAAALRQAT
ncbi:DUF1330 domain-containing protein [Nonomuraea sp. NPDC050556]|uniref:DUF1330 domain-containing protein n=1 Tax=Nonomuraea sp. NPDC050556 TaxID=3364369 RepID=UPI0037B553C3